MEITKMLTLSTIHISKETASLLMKVCKYKKELSLVIFPKSWQKEYYGWFIYVPEELTTDLETYNDVPEDLMKCLLFAKDLDCGILCLDGDGEVLDYLLKYHW